MTDDCRALLVKARESIRAAELLHREGYPDYCGSRCYYAMFYAAEALLLSQNLAFSSHGAVQAAFGKNFAKAGLVDTKFHRDLLLAFQVRQAGDYEPTPSVSPERAGELITQAKEFIEMAEHHLPAQ